MYIHGGEREHICMFHVIYLGQLHSKMIKEVLVTLACLVTTYDSLAQREIGYENSMIRWSHREYCIISSRPQSTQTMFEIPYVPYPSFLFLYNIWHAIPFSGSEGSPEMLPTYLVAWNYEYGEIDSIPISYSKISRRQVMGI